MSKPAFTPGPWAIETPMGPDAYSIVQSGLQAYEWQFIAHVPVGTPAEGMMPRHEARANARLIVALPEMFSELQKARAFVAAELEQRGDQDAVYPISATDMLASIDAALAKALGESSQTTNG